jgi:hypothetical protein
MIENGNFNMIEFQDARNFIAKWHTKF